jgi:hypothetical protein
LEFASRFSAHTYRPVARLLSGDDEWFIRESGASKRCIEKFRRQRRKVLRQYLMTLSDDFNRLFRIGLVMVVNSTEDRSDVAAHLIRQRLQLAKSIFVIRVRLILQELGFGTVDRAIMLKLLKLTHAHLELVASTALELCSADACKGE